MPLLITPASSSPDWMRTVWFPSLRANLHIAKFLYLRSSFFFFLIASLSCPSPRRHSPFLPVSFLSDFFLHQNDRQIFPSSGLFFFFFLGGGPFTPLDNRLSTAVNQPRPFSLLPLLQLLLVRIRLLLLIPSPTTVSLFLVHIYPVVLLVPCPEPRHKGPSVRHSLCSVLLPGSHRSLQRPPFCSLRSLSLAPPLSRASPRRFRTCLLHLSTTDEASQ